MKRNFRLLAMAVVAMVATTFTSCNVDDDFMIEPTVQESLQTRALGKPDGSFIINFEDAASSSLAGPTSYGDNLYAIYGNHIYYWEDPSVYAVFATNEMYGTYDFWNGGIALSKWNYMSNPTNTSGISLPTGTLTPDWWYSYSNQMSVYNTNSTDGTNTGAGHSGNNFAVVFGYVDEVNSGYMSYPEISFPYSGKVSDLWICNSAYAYGVIMNGNSWDDGEADDWVGSAHALKTFVDGNGRKGFLRVDAYGFYNGVPTNNGNPVSIYLADYNANAETGNVITTWTEWNLSALGNVTKIKFNVVGNDSGPYGLNTPAYFCLDDIHFTFE